MGGKGQRRREKNYRAAHGGETRLPPPPILKELDAIPFKLRKIMELKSGNFSAAKQGSSYFHKSLTCSSLVLPYFPFPVDVLTIFIF